MVRVKSKTKVKPKQKSISATNISPADDKRGKLLIQIDEMMETIGSTYGPVVLEELEKRIEKTISDFNDDVTEIMKKVFSKHHEDMKQIKECIDSGVVIEYPKEDETLEDDTQDESIPQYISEYEASQKKKKKKKR